MSSMGNITAFDGASTPVVHNLVAISVARNGNVIEALWREVGNISVPTYAQVRHHQKLAILKSGVYKPSIRTVVPVLESVGSQNSAGYTAAPKVAYEDTIETVGYFHPRSVLVGRRLVRQLHLNILGGITTTVTPNASGFAPELFDQLVAPT